MGTFDIETIQTEIAKVKPERQGYRELIDGLHRLLTERITKGATIRELESALSVKGIEVSERSLKTFLETGKLSRPRTAPTAKEPSSSSSDQPIE